MQTVIKFLFPVMYIFYIVGVGLNVSVGNYSDAAWVLSALLWMFNYHMLYRKTTKA